jgi:hypothetical protein
MDEINIKREFLQRVQIAQSLSINDLQFILEAKQNGPEAEAELIRPIFEELSRLKGVLAAKNEPTILEFVQMPGEYTTYSGAIFPVPIVQIKSYRELLARGYWILEAQLVSASTGEICTHMLEGNRCIFLKEEKVTFSDLLVKSSRYIQDSQYMLKIILRKLDKYDNSPKNIIFSTIFKLSEDPGYLFVDNTDPPLKITIQPPISYFPNQVFDPIPQVTIRGLPALCAHEYCLVVELIKHKTGKVCNHLTGGGPRQIIETLNGEYIVRFPDLSIGVTSHKAKSVYQLRFTLKRCTPQGFEIIPDYIIFSESINISTKGTKADTSLLLISK